MQLDLEVLDLEELIRGAVPLFLNIMIPSFTHLSGPSFEGLFRTKNVGFAIKARCPISIAY